MYLRGAFMCISTCTYIDRFCPHKAEETTVPHCIFSGSNTDFHQQVAGDVLQKASCFRSNTAKSLKYVLLKQRRHFCTRALSHWCDLLRKTCKMRLCLSLEKIESLWLDKVWQSMTKCCIFGITPFHFRRLNSLCHFIFPSGVHFLHPGVVWLAGWCRRFWQSLDFPAGARPAYLCWRSPDIWGQKGCDIPCQDQILCRREQNCQFSVDVY